MSTRTLNSCIGIGILTLLIVGCESGTRQGIAVMPDESASAMALTGHAESSIPVEYLDHGTAWPTSASIAPRGDVFMLAGTIEGKSYTGLGPSNVVRVEAINSDGEIVWAGTTRIARPSLMSREHNRIGTYHIAIPGDIKFDHFHIGVVDKEDSDKPLDIKCDMMK